ncbi:MAG: murein L,D-transpeptidase catalytic domain family protein, partial [Bacteroidota bacterium]
NQPSSSYLIMKSFLLAALFLGINIPLLSGFNSDQGIHQPEDLLTNFLYDSYNSLKGTKNVPFDLFERGMIGFLQLKKQKQISDHQNFLTLIDFRRSSIEKRLWMIDLTTGEVLFNTLVSHGKNTGLEYAKTFSNKRHSNSSSLGFYKTSESYYGRHGLSMRLDGLEQGFNDNARERAVVMHSANYVSDGFIEKHGRLGRSFGCPAIPQSFHKEMINHLKNSGVLFIYYPEKNYESNTLLNDREEALSFLTKEKELS